MSGALRTVKARRLLDKYAAELNALKLARPELPAGPATAPPLPGRHPELQEIAALKQGASDDLSQGLLGLQELRARLDSDLAALGPLAPDPVSENGAGPRGAAWPAAPAQSAVPPRAEEAGPAAPGTPGKTPAAAKAPAGGGGRFAWRLALAAAFLAGSALFLYKTFSRNTRSGFSLPPTAAAGLCLDGPGARAYFTDPRRQLLLTVSVTGRRVEAQQPFRAGDLKALAFDDTRFWATDGVTIRSYRLGSATPSDKGFKAGPGVYALSWSGGDLWAASNGGRLARYPAGEGPEPAAVFRIPEGAGRWVSVSGDRLWTLDADNGVLSAYTLSASPEPAGSAVVRDSLPLAPVAGFAVRGNAAWVVTQDPAELVRLDLAGVKPGADGK